MKDSKGSKSRGTGKRVGMAVLATAALMSGAAMPRYIQHSTTAISAPSMKTVLGMTSGTNHPQGMASLQSRHTATPSGQETQEQERRRIAVVIDDFGNNMKGTEQMLRLPISMTAAVMPFLPSTRADAEAAHAAGREVIVHLPMEPMRGKKSWLGPKAILTSLSDEEIRKRVEEAIADVPHAVGMNNHMGSRATADERVMRIVLQVCKEKGFFFLDSRTSHKSVIPSVAKELGVPLLRNDIFLDDVYTESHVFRQMGVLKTFILKHADTITIGHVGAPGMITSSVLRSSIPALGQEAAFVKLSELLPAVPEPTASSSAQGDKAR